MCLRLRYARYTVPSSVLFEPKIEKKFKKKINPCIRSVIFAVCSNFSSRPPKTVRWYTRKSKNLKFKRKTKRTGTFSARLKHNLYTSLCQEKHSRVACCIFHEYSKSRKIVARNDDIQECVRHQSTLKDKKISLSQFRLRLSEITHSDFKA